VIMRKVRFDSQLSPCSSSLSLTSILTPDILQVSCRRPVPFRHGLVRIASAEFRHLLRHPTAFCDSADHKTVRQTSCTRG
jgi:hypothetical protein